MPLLSYVQTLDVLNLDYLFINFTNPVVTYIFLVAGLLVSLSFLIGYRVKLSGVLLFFVLLTIKMRTLFMQDGGDNVIATMLPFLVLACSFNIYNGSMVNNFKNSNLQLVSKLAVLGIIIEFCLIYFIAGFSKMMYPVWRNGEALYYILRIEDFRATSLNVWLSESAFFVKFNTWFTLFWELTFPLAIWFRKTRRWYLISGVVLHLGIWMLMRIDNFSFVMLSMYPIFVSNKSYVKVCEWLLGYYRRIMPKGKLISEL